MTMEMEYSLLQQNATSISNVKKPWKCSNLNIKKTCLPSNFLSINASPKTSTNSLKIHYTKNTNWSLHTVTGFRPLDSDSRANNTSNPSHWNSVKIAADTFYRFSRPHTIIGTTLSIISVSILAIEKFSDFSPEFLVGSLEALIAAIFMNIYVVGLNQLSDIDIDRVNKPYLPLASGEYSFGTGVLIVSSFSIMSFWLGWLVRSRPLFWALFTSFILGTGYSLNIPLLRWKRSAVIAAMCIVTVRAVIVQIAFFLHIQNHVFGRPVFFSRPVIFATAFMSLFTIVIALFKDIPDIDGDRLYGIQSFTVNLGKERVFAVCISLLRIAYAIAILFGSTSSLVWSKVMTVSVHVFLALLLSSRAKSIDLKSKSSITSFYMLIWKLFYVEYLVIPFVR